jgi:hypothetical protein
MVELLKDFDTCQIHSLNLLFETPCQVNEF